MPSPAFLSAIAFFFLVSYAQLKKSMAPRLSSLRTFIFLFLCMLASITCPADAAELAAEPPDFEPQTNNFSNQLRNLIDALIGTGDYGGCANLLYGLDRSALPATATMFVPSDEGLSRLSNYETDYSPQILRYHIVPNERLSFHDLLRLKVGARLPTMLLNVSILVTNNARLNFTLDDCTVTDPGIYYDGEIAVHGIGCVLDPTHYGVQEQEDVQVVAGPEPAGGGLLPTENSNGRRTHFSDSTGLHRAGLGIIFGLFAGKIMCNWPQ